MKYLYDGSFEGFLTLLFDAYDLLEKIDGIEEQTMQLSMMEEDIYVRRDLGKARRVKYSIVKNFGRKFYSDFYCVFLSDAKNREVIAARTLKKMYREGVEICHSADQDAISFQDILKNVQREIHSYLGLVRFDEVEENILFAKITPHNNILLLIASHFQKRIPSENFILADEPRHVAYLYMQGKGQLVHYDNGFLQYGNREDEYAQMWKVFYQHISIAERSNSKLRQNNMPKKYWKNLTEFS